MKYEFSDNEILVIAKLCNELMLQCNKKEHFKVMKIGNNIIKKLMPQIQKLKKLKELEKRGV